MSKRRPHAAKGSNLYRDKIGRNLATRNAQGQALLARIEKQLLTCSPEEREKLEALRERIQKDIGSPRKPAS